MKGLLLADAETTTQGANPFAGFFNGVEGIIADFTPYLPVLIVIVVVIAGLALLLLGKKGRELVKDNIFTVLIGIAFILGAAAYASYLVAKFTF